MLAKLLARTATSSAVILGAICSSGAALFILKFIPHLHAIRCPSGTFLVAASGALGITALPLLVLCFALPPFVVFSLLPFSLAAAAEWNAAAKAKNDLSLHAVRSFFKWLAISSAMVTACTLPIALFNQSCLSNKGVYEQNFPWGHLQLREWSQIAAVETTCTYGRGGWGDKYILRFKDQSYVDLSNLTTNDNWVGVFPQLRAALHGRDFYFNPYGVGLGCSLPQANLLRTRP